MIRSFIPLSLVGIIVITVSLLVTPTKGNEYELLNRQAIDTVFSGNFVRFSILTRGEHQYVAYYDANRQMTVAYRKQGTMPWVYYKVDSWYGWDSHNYITMELDSQGHLHLMGNMHAHRMEYFRTRYAHDVRSLERIKVLENAELEKRSTYPHFLVLENGDLKVKYRSGGSGDGVEVYLSYDIEKKKWTRFHDSPLIDGQGLMNAYVEGPKRGPDGRFHMVWIWRDTPDASTNHHISYARSEDLLDWEDSAGTSLSLPITFETGDVVDPVPSGGGAINGNNKLGFDALKRPLVAFHKFDESGNTQVYLSRRESNNWVTYQVTDWEDYRWSFGGTGSLSTFEVRIASPQLMPDGNIRLPVKRLDQRQHFMLDGKTLQLLETKEASAYPPLINQVASSDEVLLNGIETYGSELMLKTLHSNGFADESDTFFYLSWEAQSPFRGQAREEILPPSTLYLHTLKRK